MWHFPHSCYCWLQKIAISRVWIFFEKLLKILNFWDTSSSVGLGVSTITFSQHSFWLADLKSGILQWNVSCVTSAVWTFRLGTTHDSCSEDMYSTLLQRYHQLEQEMGQVAEAWLECQKRIDDYVDEQVRVMQTVSRSCREQPKQDLPSVKSDFLGIFIQDFEATKCNFFHSC